MPNNRAGGMSDEQQDTMRGHRGGGGNRPGPTVVTANSVTPDGTIIDKGGNSRVSQVAEQLRNARIGDYGMPSSSSGGGSPSSSNGPSPTSTLMMNTVMSQPGATTITVSSPPNSSPIASLNRNSMPPLPQHQQISTNGHHLPLARGRSAGRMTGGALECTLLPALDRLSRSRHAGADLNAVADSLRAAEAACPGLCDQLVVELLRTLAIPQVTTSDLQAACDRLTSFTS